MKKFRAILAVVLAFTLVIAVAAGCQKLDIDDTGNQTTPATTPGGNTPATTPGGTPGGEGPTVSELTYAPGTVIRMATGYNSEKTGMSFDPNTAGSGITLANGVTYTSGELKPTWQEVQKRLNITIEDKYTGKKSSDEFGEWKQKLGDVDMVSGTAQLLTENGAAGALVDIAPYLDQMPNFKAYLDANPVVYMSIVGNTTTGAIYYSPYFDGADDIERMPLMRTDWVEKLLNGDGAFTADKSGTTKDPAYQPYMPTSGKVEVDVVSADGTKVEKITKDYDAAGGNIVALMNAKGKMSGVDAVNMLRDYIDKAYNNYYGTNRADLFIGQNAAWDADELVALLRCVCANSQTLNGTDSIQGIFTREEDNNNRRYGMVQLVGVLFGVRGLESRKDNLYIGKDNVLHDARQEVETYKAMERMHAMAVEGLISSDFVGKNPQKTKEYLSKDLGFMEYDYSQTQTTDNYTAGMDHALQEGEAFRPVMVPVARWNDGDGEQFIRFTESWRSVKTDGWGISAAGVAGNQDKLNACLKLIDYAYSTEGRILMSYGPDEFIKRNADGSYVTFDFNGEQWPQVADEALAELWERENGNYTNYARIYLGSTLSFVKSQSFEYECTHETAKIGAGYISRAIALGVIHHPELSVEANGYYTIVPTTLPLTTVENAEIGEMTQFAKTFSSEKGDDCLFIQIICDGYTDATLNSAEACAEAAAKSMNGSVYLDICQNGLNKALDFYNGLSK